MNNRNRKSGCCLFALLQGIMLITVAAGLFFLLRDTDLLHRISLIRAEHFHKLPGIMRMASGGEESMINDEKELIDFVNEQLETGHKSFTFQTEKLDDNFINNINSCTEAYYGTCTNYTTTDYRRFREIEMTCTLSDAYYVERYILHDEAIPSDRDDAVKLADKCKEILAEIDLETLTEYRKEKYFHDYIISHTVYKTEGDHDYLSSPAGPLLHGEGVCSGYARAMKLLCDLADVECRTVIGVGNGVDHEWNMVRIQEQWYHVDVTWDDPLPDQPHPMFAYLNLPDEAFGLDHTWEKKYYPQAVSPDYDYYLLNEAFCDDYASFRSYMEEHVEPGIENIRVMVGDYDKENYSEENLTFLFELSGASGYTFVTCGPAGRTEIYFEFKY